MRRKIKSRLLVLKFRKYLFVLFPVLVVNLLFLGVTTYWHMLENETLTVIKVFVQDFDFDFDYIFSFLSGLKEILPLWELALWSINLYLVIYLGKVMYNSRRELFIAPKLKMSKIN